MIDKIIPSKRLKIVLSVLTLIAAIVIILAGLKLDGVLSTESFQKLSINNIPANVSNIKSKLPRPFIVYSGSMEPAIKTASIVVSKPQEAYFPGDIITYSTGKDEFVTHRIDQKIYESNTPYFVTKGDANKSADNNPITQDQIVGKPTLIIPYVGHIANFAKTPRGFILLVIVPATIIIYEELKYLATTSKKKLIKAKSNSIIKMPPYPKASILLPVMGAGIIFIAATTSLFSDIEVVGTNNISGANTFVDHLVINEYMPDPSSGNPEWIEIYNPSTSEIDLVNWGIVTNSTTIDLSSFGSIPSKGFVNIENPLNDWIGTSDTLILKNPTDETIDDNSHSFVSQDKSIGREIDANTPFKECVIKTKGGSNNDSC